MLSVIVGNRLLAYHMPTWGGRIKVTTCVKPWRLGMGAFAELPTAELPKLLNHFINEFSFLLIQRFRFLLNDFLRRKKLPTVKTIQIHCNRTCPPCVEI